MSQKYWDPKPFAACANPGIVLRSVASAVGPSTALRNALWHYESTNYNQTEVIFAFRELSVALKDPWQTELTSRSRSR